MQNSTPISPFHKGNEGFLWKTPPKSPVYAEPNDLDTMQINSVLIWMLPEIGGGRQRGDYLHRTLFVHQPHPPPPPKHTHQGQLSFPGPLPRGKQPKFLLLILFWPLERNLVLVISFSLSVNSDRFSWNLAALSEVGVDGTIPIMLGMFRSVPTKDLKKIVKCKDKIFCQRIVRSQGILIMGFRLVVGWNPFIPSTHR